jgi:Zn-dependent protease
MKACPGSFAGKTSGTGEHSKHIQGECRLSIFDIHTFLLNTLAFLPWSYVRQYDCGRKLDELERTCMPEAQLIPVPFLLEFGHLEVDKLIIFFLSVLAAVTVNAEGQAMMATTLGDIQTESKHRFHFNPLFHLDLSGLLCFAIAGFGWPRYVPIESKKFKHPNLYLILSRFAGPLANLLLAGIAGSIVWVMHVLGTDDQVFPIVLSVNLMVFVFNFLPIPPLAGASLFTPLLPKNLDTFTKASTKVFPYLLVLFFFFLRKNHIEILNNTLYPVVRAVFSFIVG